MSYAKHTTRYDELPEPVRGLVVKRCTYANRSCVPNDERVVNAKQPDWSLAVFAMTARLAVD